MEVNTEAKKPLAKIIILHESIRESVIRDCFTFATIMALTAISWLVSSLFLDVVLVIVWSVFIIARAMQLTGTTKPMTPAEAINHIRNRFEV